jgi:hypothetical protein
MHSKISELAVKYRVSRDSIYSWIRQGLIPEDCLVRLGNSIRIKNDRFETLMSAGELWRPRRRSASWRVDLVEDQRTVQRTVDGYGHRWVSENRSVSEGHPYSEEMKALAQYINKQKMNT